MPPKSKPSAAAAAAPVSTPISGSALVAGPANEKSISLTANLLHQRLISAITGTGKGQDFEDKDNQEFLDQVLRDIKRYQRWHVFLTADVDGKLPIHHAAETTNANIDKSKLIKSLLKVAPFHQTHEKDGKKKNGKTAVEYLTKKEDKLRNIFDTKSEEADLIDYGWYITHREKGGSYQNKLDLYNQIIGFCIKGKFADAVKAIVAETRVWHLHSLIPASWGAPERTLNILNGIVHKIGAYAVEKIEFHGAVSGTSGMALAHAKNKVDKSSVELTSAIPLLKKLYGEFLEFGLNNEDLFPALKIAVKAALKESAPAADGAGSAAADVKLNAAAASGAAAARGVSPTKSLSSAESAAGSGRTSPVADAALAIAVGSSGPTSASCRGVESATPLARFEIADANSDARDKAEQARLKAERDERVANRNGAEAALSKPPMRGLGFV
jgi:hypothetical protein